MASRPVLAVNAPQADTPSSTAADRELFAETNCCIPNQLTVVSPLFSVSVRAPHS